MRPEWAVSIRDQCAEAGVHFFFKQFGEYGPDEEGALRRLGKKRAGRRLDGHVHDAMPESVHIGPTVPADAAAAEVAAGKNGASWAPSESTSL